MKYIFAGTVLAIIIWLVWSGYLLMRETAKQSDREKGKREKGDGHN